MLRLEAFDTVYFGGGKPFNKDGDNWTGSLFPPSPSVLFGALRTAYFAEHVTLVGRANEPDDPTRRLRLKGTFLVSGEDVYFPMPLDLVTFGDDDREVFLLSLEEQRLVSSCPTPMCLRAPDDRLAETVESGLLELADIRSYLSGKPGGFPYSNLREFVTPEPNLGIGLDNARRVAEDRHLYRIGMIRPEKLSGFGRRFSTRKLGLLLDFEGLELPAEGMLKLGGEGRAALYKQCEGEWIHQLSCGWPKQGSRFKVYLATPAKFEKGWLPKWIDEESLEGSYKGVRLKLLTAAVGKPLPVGGFDIKAGRPKPMMRAVPAGSVYYFEILDGTDLQQAMKLFHYENISDVDGHQGFGLAFAGGIMG